MSECVAIPVVRGIVWGDWSSLWAGLAAGAKLEFGQSWLPKPDADLRPGAVWLGVEGGRLLVLAKLTDHAPANRAKTWNEATWMTGDVLELFFQAEGREGYFEFHVTPENQRLQLFFPSSAAFREKRGHRHWSIMESRFESMARIVDGGEGWEVAMAVPLATVLDLPREGGSRRFRFSFSRYDFQPGRIKPVTSSTSPLSRPDFHHVPEWLWAEVEAV